MQTSQRIVDGNGFFRVDRNPLSKTGVFPYMGRELPGAPDPDAQYRVYRPAEELSSEACLDSFRLVPLVDEHTWLGKHGTPAEQKGIHGTTGDAAEFDGEYLRAPLKIYSQSMADQIAAGKCELSSGYACRYDWTPGEFNGEQYDAIQRDIRANHVALVDAGRMGPDVRVLDHRFPIAFDSMEYVEMPPDKSPTVEQLAAQIAELMPVLDMVKELQKTLAGAKSEPEAEAAAIEAEAVAGEVIEAASEVEEAASEVEAAPVMEEDSEAEVELVEKEKALDAAVSKLAKLKVPTAKGMDAAIRAGTARTRAASARSGRKVSRLAATAGDSAVSAVAARDAIATRLHKHVGVFDHAPMTTSAVVAYGVDKLGLPKETTHDALSAYLAGRESVPTTNPGRAADSAPAGGALAAHIAKHQER